MSIVNPADPPERREEKLLRITEALMRRVEHSQTTDCGSGYAQFQRAVMLEQEVRQRTGDLEATLSLLNRSNAKLSEAIEAERRARADLSDALEAVKDGFALFGGDGRMVMFNSRFCQALPDVRPGLHIGVDIDDYFDLVSRSRYLDRGASSGPDDWAQWRRRQRREAHSTFTVKLTDGTYFQVSENRTPEGGSTILQTDVTEMIRIERNERERLLDGQARLLHATLEHIDQGVAIFDPKERLVGWNRRLVALLEPPLQLVRIGMRFRKLFVAMAEGVEFHAGADARVVIDWVSNRVNRSALHFELTRGGRALAGFAQVMPDGGFVTSFADVTAERAAARALHEANETLERHVAERTRELELTLAEAKRANATKSRFVAAASHDLLQPLAAAKLFVASLESIAGDSVAVETARRAGNALDGVKTILDDLLEISKLDSGHAVMKPEPIDLDAMLRRLWDEFLPQAEAKGLRLSFRSLPIHIVSDPAYFRRILQNLIANAIRYTQKGGVLVGARRRGRLARVEIWDTGPGVPEERRAEIFEEFQRLDATASAAEGLGLGLSIVDRAARMLEHPIGLSSKVERGSCFSIEAPLTESVDKAAVASGAPARPMGENMLVLIIASDGPLRTTLGGLLENWDVLTFEAANEAEALSVLQETGVRPDAILAEFAATARIGALSRLTAEYGAMPTAMISSDVSSSIERICGRRGWSVIRPPVGADDMLQFLAAAALHSGARRGA